MYHLRRQTFDLRLKYPLQHETWCQDCSIHLSLSDFPLSTGELVNLFLLLDHHQEVLGIFSEDTTSPSKLQPLVSNAQLDST